MSASCLRSADTTTLQEIHRKFLLGRDLAAISLVLGIGGTVGLALASAGVLEALKYFLVMLLHYFVLAIVAQNNGKEFVCQVLVEYVAAGEHDGKEKGAGGTGVDSG